MTLTEFFEVLSNQPSLVLGYFLLIPFTAFLAGIMGKGEGHLSPWKYLYATLVYLVSVPGIFAITLNIYLFLFERRSIMDTDVYSQVLPIFSMIATLLIIRNNVAYERIPGFGKLSGLMMMIFAVLTLMWGLDRTRIYIIAFTSMPFYYVIAIFIVLLIAFRIGMKKLMGPAA